MRTEQVASITKGGMWIRSLRSALIATALSVLLVVVFALILQQQWLGLESIAIINPIIKVIAAAAAAWLTIRRCSSRCWFWGMAGAAMFMLITFFVFSLLSGEFKFGTGTLIDLAMCAAAGLAIGVLKNLKG